MNKDQKSQVINQLTEKFAEYQNVYITDIASLNAQKTSDLRRALFKEGIELQMAKNTLIEKAMERSGRNFGKLSDTLVGNTALMFSTDMKAPAKAIKEFRKGTKGDPKPYLKGALIDTDAFIGDDQLDALIALKTKNELIGEIIGLLQSPAQNVISALQSGGNKLTGIVKTLSEKPE